MDGVALSFPFTVVDSDRIGSSNEKFSTQHYRTIVSISDTRRKGWQLSDEDQPKVLFDYGKHFVQKNIESDSLPSDHTIRMPMITNASDPGACPLELSRLQMPGSITVQVEVQRKMGFKT
jgi:hypothetical protein